MVKRNVLLNPGPATTTDSVKQALIIPDICPREKEFGAIMREIRDDLVRIAGGNERYTSVLFGGSGTAVMDATINSVVPPGGKLLVIENGAYGARMARIARTYGIEVVELGYVWGERIRLHDVEAKLVGDADIDSVVVIHHETTTGILNPVKEIGEISKRFDCTFIVDTISSFAGVPFDIKECKIDFMMSTSNKCIQGMAGAAFVICRKSALEKIKDFPKRSFYLDLYSQFHYLEKHGQTPFTPPVQVLYSLKQAIKEFFEETAEKRYARYRKNHDTLISGLKERGFRFFLEDYAEPSNILTTIYAPRHPGFDFDALHDRLYERGFTIYPGKLQKENTFRIAVMGAIDHHDISDFLEALDEVMKEMGIEIETTPGDEEKLEG